MFADGQMVETDAEPKDVDHFFFAEATSETTDEKKTAPTTAASSSTKSCLASAMPFAYPVVVGLLESLVQVFQKGGSSMIALTVAGTSQLGDDTFWYVMSAWVLCSVAVVFWLRKGLENIAANRMLPIEYGTFTAASVLAGLVIYDEVRFVSAAHRGVMAAGVLLVSAGCALVGSRRALRCECSVRCTHPRVLCCRRLEAERGGQNTFKYDARWCV